MIEPFFPADSWYRPTCSSIFQPCYRYRHNSLLIALLVGQKRWAGHKYIKAYFGFKLIHMVENLLIKWQREREREKTISKSKQLVNCICCQPIKMLTLRTGYWLTIDVILTIRWKSLQPPVQLIKEDLPVLKSLVSSSLKLFSIRPDPVIVHRLSPLVLSVVPG